MNEIYDELNRMAKVIYEESENLPNDEKKKKIEEDVLDLLVEMYLAGVYRIGDDTYINLEEMNETIYFTIEGKTWADRIRERIDDDTLDALTLAVIVETDGHRVFETSYFQTAQKVQVRTGKQLYKTWVTMDDLLVRPTHSFLEGDVVPLETYFETYDGDRALYPGGFEKAENNINCRCFLLIK